MSKGQIEAQGGAKGEWDWRQEQETTKRKCQAKLQAQRGKAIRPPISKLPVIWLKHFGCLRDLASDFMVKGPPFARLTPLAKGCTIGERDRGGSRPENNKFSALGRRQTPNGTGYKHFSISESQ